MFSITRPQLRPVVNRIEDDGLPSALAIRVGAIALAVVLDVALLGLFAGIVAWMIRG